MLNEKSNSHESVGTLFDELLFSTSSTVKSTKNDQHLKSLSLI